MKQVLSSLIVVPSVLRTNGRRTNPFKSLTKFDTALENNIYHRISTCVVGANIDTTSLPGVKHLITAVPVTKEHNAVVWCCVERIQLVHAEFDSLMKSAHLTMILIMSGKFSLVMASINYNVLPFEEIVQVFVADSFLVHLIVMILDFQAHMFDHTFHIIFTDVLIG